MGQQGMRTVMFDQSHPTACLQWQMFNQHGRDVLT